jgi:YD repeat-containing protein
VTQTDAKAQVTTLAYDPLSRVASKTVTGAGLATETTSNLYDEVASPRSPFNRGKLTTATRSVASQTINGTILAAVNASQQFDYDLAGRPIKTTHANINGTSKVVETSYWQDGTTTGDYVYDLAGRLASIDNIYSTAGQPDWFIQSAQYNARGQTIKITYGDGTVTDFTYSATRGWLDQLVSKSLSGTSLLNETYDRNTHGMITKITSTPAGSGWTYSYDGMDRLLTATSEVAADSRSYAYDDADNMVWNSGLCAGSPNMVYPATGAAHPHAPTSICGTAVSYDANGNTTNYDVDGSGPKLPRTLTYDLENRPLIILRNGVAATMAYGPDGERTSKSYLGTTTSFLGNEAEYNSGTGLFTL